MMGSVLCISMLMLTLMLNWEEGYVFASYLLP